MKPVVLSALLLLSVPLAACGGNDANDETAFQDAVGEDNVVTPVTPQGAGPSLKQGPDFAEVQLGPKVTNGAVGERTTQFTGPNGPAGQVRSYVACPTGVTTCNTNDLSAATVYTYVAEVTPAARTSVFRTAHALSGFTGSAGFDQAQAKAASGPGSHFAIRCVNGALVWAIDGGNGWSGMPVRFYWQSTSPPEASDQAFQLIEEGATVDAAGLVPSGDFDSACNTD